MKIQTDIPELAVLRDEVVLKAGFQMKTHADFLNLVTLIEHALHEHISETTLERLWNYSTRGYSTVSERSLDVLSKFIGDEDWNAFKRRQKFEAQIESESFGGEIISSKDLKIGDKLRIGWRPDRICVVRYLGDNRFICEHSENATIQPDDTFSCLQFQKGRELFMDRFVHVLDGEMRYVVGKNNGLTTVEKIAPDTK